MIGGRAEILKISLCQWQGMPHSDFLARHDDISISLRSRLNQGPFSIRTGWVQMNLATACDRSRSHGFQMFQRRGRRQGLAVEPRWANQCHSATSGLQNEMRTGWQCGSVYLKCQFLESSNDLPWFTMIYHDLHVSHLPKLDSKLDSRSIHCSETKTTLNHDNPTKHRAPWWPFQVTSSSRVR